jgi:periplasmic protein TonB
MSAAARADRFGGGDVALWAGAAALAILAHAGVALWAVREPAPEPLAAAAPAVMIDLAPAAAAPQAEKEQLSPDPVDAPEIEVASLAEALARPPDAPPPPPPDPTVETPAPEPPPIVEPPSPVAMADLPAVAEPLPEMPVQPVTRPVARPPDLEVARAEPPPETEPEREPEREPEPARASQAAVRAQTRAPVAERAAAPENARSSRGAVSPAKWQSRLMAHLERLKRYPAAARRRGEEGVVHVRFSIDAGGNVRSANLVRSSGHPELDQAVLALVQRASPVPAPPPGAPHDITAPVRFNIR